MLGLVKEISGQKTIVPLTTDTGTGAPVGSIIVVCSNILPSGYLGLGVQYDITNYPALYQVLGTDTTPTASALGLPTLSSGQYAIKATSGLAENQQENVLNTINENLSYSTTEHKTGKKWIDGKPIYEKTIIQNLEGANPFIGKVDVTHGIENIHTPIRIVTAKASSQSQGDDWNMGITIPAKYDNTTFAELGQFTQTTVSLYAGTTNWTSLNKVLFTLEYTKTTDN